MVTLRFMLRLLQPVVVCGFQEMTGNLQDLITQALEHIKGQETGITALKLACLSLEGYSQVSVQTNELFLYGLRRTIWRRAPILTMLQQSGWQSFQPGKCACTRGSYSNLQNFWLAQPSLNATDAVRDELRDSEIPPFLKSVSCGFQDEASFMKAAMDKVQSSYLRSLQEVGDLLKKRAETIKNLKIWAPSHTLNKDDCTPTIACQPTS